eukprot:3431381-Pleurochrysis_carterae.AAC.1
MRVRMRVRVRLRLRARLRSSTARASQLPARRACTRPSAPKRERGRAHTPVTKHPLRHDYLCMERKSG